MADPDISTTPVHDDPPVMTPPAAQVDNTLPSLPDTPELQSTTPITATPQSLPPATPLQNNQSDQASLHPSTIATETDEHVGDISTASMLPNNPNLIRGYPLRHVLKVKKLHAIEDGERNPFTGQPWTDHREVIRLQRDSLPVRQNPELEAQILKIAKRQVTFIKGAPGSGKTTQLPQYIARSLHYDQSTRAIAVTHPRRHACESSATRHAAELDVNLGTTVGITMRLKNLISPSKTYIHNVTDGTLFNLIRSDPLLSHYDYIFIDEVHERSINIDHLLLYLRTLLRSGKRPTLHLVLLSATGDFERLGNYFQIDHQKAITLPSLPHQVEVIYATEPVKDLVVFSLDTVKHIYLNEKCTGDTLIFAWGQDQVKDIMKKVNEWIKTTKIPLPDFQVFPFFRDLSKEEKDNATSEPSYDIKKFDKRPIKIIVSTNIAETSITFPFLERVINLGLAKEKTYDAIEDRTRLLATPISKSAEIQRAGRVGRTKPGTVYHGYTQKTSNELELHHSPSAVRENLTEALFLRLSLSAQLKKAGIEGGLWDELPDNPSPHQYLRAADSLLAVGAVDRYMTMTNMGAELINLGLDATLGRALLASFAYGCSQELIDIVALCSTSSQVFFTRLKNDQLALKAQLPFRDPMSDHLSEMNVFRIFLAGQSGSYNESITLLKDAGINIEALQEAMANRDRIIKSLGDNGYRAKIKSLSPAHPDYYKNICCSLITGLHQNLAIRSDCYAAAVNERDVLYHNITGKTDSDLYLPRKNSLMDTRYIVYTEASIHLNIEHGTFVRRITCVLGTWIEEALSRIKKSRSSYNCIFIVAASLEIICGGYQGSFLHEVHPKRSICPGAVAVSGIRVLAYAAWTRRDRFIATCAFAFGLASLCVPTWFNYIFTYEGDNAGLKGLIEAVILIVEEPYLISALLAVFLNATLPEEFEEEAQEEAGHHEWNQPTPLVGSAGSRAA